MHVCEIRKFKIQKERFEVRTVQVIEIKVKLINPSSVVEVALHREVRRPVHRAAILTTGGIGTYVWADF